MLCFLWTPEDLIALDLEPMLARAREAAAALETAPDAAATPRQRLSAREIVRVLGVAIEMARETTPYSETAARELARRLRQRASLLPREAGGFVLCRAADAAELRLMPHLMDGELGSPVVPTEVRLAMHRRFHQLRARGELVWVERRGEPRLAPPRRRPGPAVPHGTNGAPRLLPPTGRRRPEDHR